MKEGFALPTLQDESFESLYRKNLGKLTIYAKARLEDPFLAEEAVQETFYTALTHPELLDRYGKPEACLMNILKNKIRECRRARRRYLRLFLSLDDGLLAGACAPGGSASAGGILEAARAGLSPEEWHLLRRFALDGASHLEISRELGVSVWASQKRLERIRKKLQEILPDP